MLEATEAQGEEDIASGFGVLKCSLDGPHEGASEDRGAGRALLEREPSPTGSQKDLKVARVPVLGRNFYKGVHALLLCLSF